ncbi:MAG: N-formylglutamate amidohydrolase [Ornithinimicrobium sp.]|uniref:N-formylglutamate amidohydrolase n=1 Tax=Ornithinimicrobium sp. TaxID=1977084 RepID=UPI0026DEB5F6|nr:N-formylglutamate amidohydrolase [Ornithinimicrobium sp.]MDO5740765.1 N-formylglutamate amidohydrolase [Ornithinimicrobium sp.]
MPSTQGTHSVLGDWSGQLIATAIHTGHDLRSDIAAAMVLDEDTRRREEDPFTDVIGAALPAQVVAHRSRFEVDLNRPRDTAVYRSPEDCWGLQVWREDPLQDALVEGSLREYDEFYSDLGHQLDEVAARGPFVVFDVHSYNHRRDGAAGGPAPLEDNPEVNLGTGTVDERFAPVVAAFRRSLSDQQVGGHHLDVRENVKFEGRALAWWVHERYAGVGVCLALEFKKTFMDEWTGQPDEAHLVELQQALAATSAPVLEALKAVGMPSGEVL